MMNGHTRAVHINQVNSKITHKLLTLTSLNASKHIAEFFEKSFLASEVLETNPLHHQQLFHFGFNQLIGSVYQSRINSVIQSENAANLDLFIN